MKLEVALWRGLTPLLPWAVTVEHDLTRRKSGKSARAYNDSVMAYNTQREVFPSSVIAGMFHFTAAELFAIEKPEQREPTKISFA